MYNMAKDNKAIGKMAVFVASHTNKIYALVYLSGIVYALSLIHISEPTRP